uniref:Pyruvate dehydrogenase n=1 Tax=Rhizophora mucronata TaxID=61149 RepID=A0A2P2LR47_RHIMU
MLNAMESLNQLTISFHGNNLQVTSKIPSIQPANGNPIPISSHCYCICYSKIRMLIEWISGSAVKICKYFGKATSRYTTPLI